MHEGGSGRLYLRGFQGFRVARSRMDAKTKKDEKKRIVFHLIAVMFTTRDGILMERGRGSLLRDCNPRVDLIDRYVRPARKVNFMFQRSLRIVGRGMSEVLDVAIESHRCFQRDVPDSFQKLLITRGSPSSRFGKPQYTRGIMPRVCD